MARKTTLTNYSRFGSAHLPAEKPVKNWLVWLGISLATALLWVLTASPLRALIEKNPRAQGPDSSGTWIAPDSSGRSATLTK